jgi:glucosamine--fructose-6-phosphate aminotransferase (isomerizing)
MGDVFFIGRGLDQPATMESSLKLKEISYIHSEAYAAGELKHGTISLITPGVPVVSLCSQKALAPKLISNIKEVRARGAYTIALAPAGHLPANEDFCNILIGLEALPDLLMPFTVAVAVQLLAYHAAAFRGCDIDKPRNLAKSVTVE